MMTLDDNPLVNAQKRVRILYLRRGKVIAYRWSRCTVEYAEGVAAKMFINPYVKAKKADRLIAMITKEIRANEKIIKAFK